MIEKNFDIPFIAALALREKQIQQNYRPVIAVHKGLLVWEWGTFCKSVDVPGPPGVNTRLSVRERRVYAPGPCRWIEDFVLCCGLVPAGFA